MCGGGGFKTSSVKAAPTAPPIVAPIEADQTSKSAREQEKRKRLAATGRSSTILTSGLGDANPVETAKKNLLGS